MRSFRYPGHAPEVRPVEGHGCSRLELPRHLTGSMLSRDSEEGRPAGPRTHCTGAVAQAASIVVSRFLDAVCQIIGVSRIIAVL